MEQVSGDGISIITIVLNGEDYIEETILSVISQKNVNIEYIIIDGGSVDKTLEIIQRYKDQINLIISEPDKGVYYAFNKGLNLVKNKLVGIINCGDFYEPNTLHLVVNMFSETSADIIYGDIRILEQNEHETILNRVCRANHQLLYKKMSIFHPATFIKRECYSKYGLYNTNYKIAADYDLILHFYMENLTFFHLSYILANFRTGGISSTKHKLLFKENFQIRKNRINLKSAIIYLISTIPFHLFFSYRKLFIELIVGKRNYILLKKLVNK